MEFAELMPFNEQFLSGFRTETYQVDVKEGFEIGKEKMNDFIRQEIRRDIGGDHQQILHMNVHHADVTFKHILLPYGLVPIDTRKKYIDLWSMSNRRSARRTSI
jgi:hypothetical protein